jgi:hypothetical protein
LLFTHWTNIPDGVNTKQGCEPGDNISWLTRVYTGLFEAAVGLKVTQILAFLQTRILRENSSSKINFKAVYLAVNCGVIFISHYVSDFVVYFTKISVAMPYSVESHGDW